MTPSGTNAGMSPAEFEGDTMYRQGDVLLIPASVPTATTLAARDKGRLVLAYGEVTGHAHVIDAPAERASVLTTADNERFLRIVGAAAPLVHEEHATISVAPGDYRVIIDREWSDALASQPVLD